MHKYCFDFYFGSSIKQYTCTTDDNLVALYLLAKYLVELDDFNFIDYDVPCYCWIDGQCHNFSDAEITFFRKVIGLE